MNKSVVTQIKQGINTAFLDSTAPSNLAYKPQFISNDYKAGRKVLSSIEDELLVCDSFSISVAFITMDGITPLLQTLKELENRHIPGRILTTDYLNFSQPNALKKLAQLKNVELKMYRIMGKEEGFHTKGYIFKDEEVYRIIVGSSNMTKRALTTNKEWNTKIISTMQGEYADADNHIYLFVRKNKHDKETSKEFYFLGEINAVGEPKPIFMESTKDNAFEITYHLDVPVREDIYNYIKGE